MSMQNTPASERIHIGIFGKRNAGKSSLINALTGQDLAIVSDVKGTTTDPVLKTMELLPLGPVVMIDTPGLDDTGVLGEERIKKTYQILNKTDIALLIVDASEGFSSENQQILNRIKEKEIPYLVVYNKSDLLPEETPLPIESSILVSARNQENIFQLKERIAALLPDENRDKPIVRDLINENDVVVLVVPIDSAAPKGRLILPQQQTIRDLLEANALPIIAKENTLRETLASLQKDPALVITDSQVFQTVNNILPSRIPLTSFSILFARYKGDLDALVEGADALDSLKDGSHVLISEGCTHHRQCDDIGTVKLPRWLKEYTGASLQLSFTSGTEFPMDLSAYDLIIHCGGCMLNEREMKYRIRCAKDNHVPITNYGTAIAKIKGILAKSLKPFENQ
ncbi:[FeFe] hydrogenase H-cluster maturation GTPase HydF [Aequitasia blattaphilus]|uniref:[FeFe] hydrogenase H-cluster maturation GTPase HydF n=1 Tax=Aequitasia blattaphilus TaxID=2949332 RepID=A0ABT1E7W7_9FIRM|nr:[FeFe] hydrogenase H-cluster maturation GTPase HydF [Aequitasia blattaphilus]MCP1101920.1 [FeFe] hydrogenase H-cluster maturation GTPase HydF [Aequitasia blattaphilus]MCR8614560.1 [FeFe] hydrogenase H-cluster maturation GTPase HydF [Aequitasia blattaphilus]